MQVVRKIIKGTELKNIVDDIPSNFMNKELEILIIPIEKTKKRSKTKKSLSGFLSKYANTNLIKEEENAWYEEAKE